MTTIEITRCRYCCRENLTWVIYYGVKRLADVTGKVHVCDEYLQERERLANAAELVAFLERQGSGTA